MNPHALESLYEALGRPAWFWPVFFILLLGLLVLGSSFSPECP